MQGIRPASLQKVGCQDLAEFIALCISPIAERPHARQLLKHRYFDAIRHNLGALKLGMCALAPAGGNSAELMNGCAAGLADSLSAPPSVAGDLLSGLPPSCAMLCNNIVPCINRLHAVCRPLSLYCCSCSGQIAWQPQSHSRV